MVIRTSGKSGGKGRNHRESEKRSQCSPAHWTGLKMEVLVNKRISYSKTGVYLPLGTLNCLSHLKLKTFSP